MKLCPHEQKKKFDYPRTLTTMNKNDFTVFDVCIVFQIFSPRTPELALAAETALTAMSAALSPQVFQCPSSKLKAS